MWLIEDVILGLYTLTLLLLAIFGLNLLIALLAAVFHHKPRPPANPPERWPEVLVQVPLYNERYVVERVIDSVAALDYPPDRLHIQILDDSTDETAQRARARVAYHRARGVAMTYLHRSTRDGYKAGALAEGLAAVGPAPEFVAIFDADFAPPRDFLRRLLPDFLADPRLGLVQARWEHLNPQRNALTLAQALALDGYFCVEQVARSRAGWLLNFNGSAGVWRRACIEDAGGWQGDTLAEDLDLSYRAQLRGWRLDYRLEVAAPAELPSTLLSIKRQQFRWAKGSFQVLRKLGRQVLTARLDTHRKLLALLHLAGYLPQPLAVLSLLLSLPVVLIKQSPLDLSVLGWLGLTPLLAVLWGQLRLGRGLARLSAYPLTMLGMIGLALSNTRAFAEALAGRRSEFQRTPKTAEAHDADYAVPLDWTTWGELLLAAYALFTGCIAQERLPALAPVLFMYAASFGLVGVRSLWESVGAFALSKERRRESKEGT
ncbi:MAG: glycosyltransferase [Anaerolineales bacterium]|nr:glycosyltransferase [Anaerolineales bacterium]